MVMRKYNFYFWSALVFGGSFFGFVVYGVLYEGIGLSILYWWSVPLALTLFCLSRLLSFVPLGGGDDSFDWNSVI